MLLTALALAAALAATPVVTAPTETIIMLKLASSPEAKRHEQRLYDELGLVLDGFGLVAVEPDDPAFVQAPLPAQLEQVFALAQNEGAVAVVWLARDAKGRLLLELVAQRTGRTLIRSIESGGRAATERTLALAVRELLATAFLFEPPDRQPAPVSALVTELKAEVLGTGASGPPPAEPEAPPSPRWAGRGEAGVLLGISGDVGFGGQALGALRATRAFGDWVRAGISVEAAGSRGSVGTANAVSWWRFTPGVLLVAGRTFERFALGLGLLLGASAMRWESFGPAGNTQGLAWAFRADVLVELGVRVVSQLWLVLSPGAGWLSHQVAVSDGAQVRYVTPKVALRLAAGLELRF